MTVGAPTLLWVPPGGEEINLSPTGLDVAGYLATSGVRGLGLPSVTITADAMPRGGTRVRHQQALAKAFTLPVFVEGSGVDELTRAENFVDRWRFFGESLESTRRLGPGQIIVARPNGSRRLLDAYYETGWDNDPDAGVTWDMCPVTFYCENPYWRAGEETLITRTFGSVVAASFLSPLITVTSSQTLGASSATNPGSVEAWPTWRIDGPASHVLAENNTTGEAWELDPVAWRGSALIAGESVYVTTEPATVIGPASGPQGTNWAGAINWPDAVLWGLDPGENDIDFTVSGSGAATVVEASFYARYGTA